MNLSRPTKVVKNNRWEGWWGVVVVVVEPIKTLASIKSASPVPLSPFLQLFHCVRQLLLLSLCLLFLFNYGTDLLPLTYL